MDIEEARRRLSLLWKMERENEFLVKQNQVLLVEDVQNWKQALSRILGREGNKSLFFIGNSTVSECEKVRDMCEKNRVFVMFDKNLVSPNE